MDQKHAQRQEEQLHHFLSQKHTLSRDFFILSESGVRFGERVLKGVLHHLILNERDMYSYLNALHETVLGFGLEDRFVNAQNPNQQGRSALISPYREDLLNTGWTVFDAGLIRKAKDLR